MPQKPEYSYTAQVLLNAYNTIARSRKFSDGIPMALSAHDINAYLSIHELPTEIDILNEVIFTLDNDYMKEECEKMERQRVIDNRKNHKK